MLLLLAALTLLSANCQQEKNQPNPLGDDSEFIFGVAYGFCAGNCVHLYKIIDGKIYPDLMDQGNPAEATFSDTPLGEAEYALALPVKEQFPEALFEEEAFIGCPNCVDQGAYFLQVQKGDETFQWHIDPIERNLPAYLQPYAKMIGEVVAALRE